MKVVAEKHPSDIVDYVITFAGDGMGNDNIFSATATGVGLTVNSVVISGNSVQVWVSGGVAGTPGTFTIAAVTVDNRTYNRTYKVPIAVI